METNGCNSALGMDYSALNDSGMGSGYNISDTTWMVSNNNTTDCLGPNVRRRADQPNSNCLIYDFVIEAVMMGFFCLFGFAGNTLSMMCLWKDKGKNATPFLLISLEIADTLFLVTVLLLRVLTSIHQFTNWFRNFSLAFFYFGSYVYPMSQVAMTSTIYITILVTVNRYISVCRPYEASSLCSIQQARKQVTLVWILCIIYNIPRFFEYSVDTRYNPVTKQNVTRSFPTILMQNPIYAYGYGSALYFIVMFLVPLVTLIILNYKLICALRETKKRRAILLTHDSNSHSEDDITLTLIVVVLVYLFTQTPALITQILVSILSRKAMVCPSSFFYYVRASDLLVVANSASNFIIYCFCSKRFRQILVMLMCKRKLDSPENSASHTANHVVKHYKPVSTKDEGKNGHVEITAV